MTLCSTLVLMENFGRFVSQKREELGISQERLGELAGVSGATISKIESGEIKSPKLDVILGLSQAFRIPVMDLILAYQGKSEPWRPGTSLPHDQLDRLWEAMADIYPPDYLGKKIDEALRRKRHE